MTRQARLPRPVAVAGAGGTGGGGGGEMQERGGPRSGRRGAVSAGGMGRLRDWARRVTRDAAALWLAAKNPRTPFAAKLVAAAVAAYALSPIDLIPDFIPVLGLLDDALIVPLGVLLAVRLVPPALMAEFRAEAERMGRRPVSRAGAVAVALLWALGVGLLAWVLWPTPARAGFEGT